MAAPESWSVGPVAGLVPPAMTIEALGSDPPVTVIAILLVRVGMGSTLRAGGVVSRSTEYTDWFQLPATSCTLMTMGLCPSDKGTSKSKLPSESGQPSTIPT